MAFDFSAFPKKINLGCGHDKREGFLNVDINGFHKPDLECDITDLHMLPSGYYEYALANDILEHIPRLRTKNVLKEWNRILKIGGKLELRIPSVTGLLSLFTRRENKTPEFHETLIQCLFGTQTSYADFHYTGFTEILISKMLEDAGFRIERLAVQDEWLFCILAEKITDKRVDEMMYLSDESFIDAVYERYLGRKPDAEGYQYFLELIKSGIAREAVISAIQSSVEYRENRKNSIPSES